MRCIKTKRARNSDVEKDDRNKSGPRPDFQNVHKARVLRDMLKTDLARLYGSGQVSDCSDELVEAILKQARHWLLDHSHALIMNRRHAEVPLIHELLTNLGDE